MQRNFEPLKQQINEWQTREISSDQAKLIIYRAFVEHRFPLGHFGGTIFGVHKYALGREKGRSWTS